MRFSLYRIAVAAAAIVIPLAAQAQFATNFDGIYAGVSETATSCTAGTPVPRPLTIKGGTAQWSPRPGGNLYQGTVGANGIVMLRDNANHIINAKIEANGKITGIANSNAGECVFTRTWQKQ